MNNRKTIVGIGIVLFLFIALFPRNDDSVGKQRGGSFTEKTEEIFSASEICERKNAPETFRKFSDAVSRFATGAVQVSMRLSDIELKAHEGDVDEASKVEVIRAVILAENIGEGDSSSTNLVAEISVDSTEEAVSFLKGEILHGEGDRDQLVVWHFRLYDRYRRPVYYGRVAIVPQDQQETTPREAILTLVFSSPRFLPTTEF